MKNNMKKLGILFLLVFLGPVAIMAIKPFEGVITYNITYPDSKLTESQLQMVPKVFTVSVKGTKARTELSMSTGNQISIIDYNDKTVTNLINIMGQKFAIKKTSQDIEKEIAEEPVAKVDVTNETKNIAGYTCKKAIITTVEDGEKTTLEVFFTTEIGGKGINFDNSLYKDIDGVMMEFLEKTPQVMMKFSASSVEKKSVAMKDFEIPADYKLTTEEELKTKFGGGGK